MGIEPVTMGTAEKETNLEDCGSTVMLTKDMVVAEPGEQRPSFCSMWTANYMSAEDTDVKLLPSHFVSISAALTCNMLSP